MTMLGPTVTVHGNRPRAPRLESGLLDEYGLAARSRPTSIRRPTPREQTRYAGVER